MTDSLKIIFICKKMVFPIIHRKNVDFVDKRGVKKLDLSRFLRQRLWKNPSFPQFPPFDSALKNDV
jgi:hypothetical protein